MKTFLLIIATLSLTACGGSSGGAASANSSSSNGSNISEKEGYNDDANSAQLIKLGDSVKGDVTDGVDEYDYYEVSLTGDKNIEIKITSDADLGILFHSSDYGTYRSLSSTTSPFSMKVLSSEIESGTYKIAVWQIRESGEYILSVK